MMVSDSFSVRDNHLMIGGVDTVKLAQQYKTPLYVMDEDAIRAACRGYQASIQRFYNGKGLVLYASKAFSCKEIYRIMKEESMGIDVVSGGELYTAISAGFPAEKIYFHGNNKTPEELEMALKYRVGCIVLDNLEELKRLSTLLEEQNLEQQVMLRVKPGVDAHTHDFIRTGQIDSKFGFALETGEAMAAIQEVLGCSRLRLIGLHCHIGSQIFDIEPFCLAAEIMIQFMKKVQEKTGVTLSVLNLGGGFGIKYLSSHDPVASEEYMKCVSETIHRLCAQLEMEIPFILIEPGRSIVGGAGLTLYHVGSVKEIPKIRTYVSVDGGMTDNPRFALYRSEYEVVIANRAGEPKTRKVAIAGKCCESGDLLAEDVYVQECSAGDILAVLCTGAYNYSMASNYNRIPRPPVVMVRDGKDRLVIRRETYEDLLHNDL